ncbi:MAG: macro domain-containing protein [Candidatus Helarchaeota archaeon]
MKIIFCDLNKNMILAWEKYFGDDSNFEIYHGSIFDVNCDAIVSPANSFGFMDGGLDLQITKFFGFHIQTKLQDLIKEKHHGELLVGCAEIVPTKHDEIPFVISAPTMRVPMVLKDTINVFLATRAVLLLIKYGKFADGIYINDKIKRVTFPGMGAGVGHVPSHICALQMKKAVDEIYFEKYQFPKSWMEAQVLHQLLYRTYTTDLQFDG